MIRRFAATRQGSAPLKGGNHDAQALLLGIAVLAGLASAAWWTQQAGWTGTANAVEDPGQATGSRMAAAAEKFVTHA